MTTAVHGKAALAEMLLDDGAAPGKSGDDDRDKVDTVDFGATLMSLVDPAVANKSSGTAGAGASAARVSSTSGEQSVAAASPFDSDADDASSTSFGGRTIPPSEHYLSALMETSVAPADAQTATPEATGATGRTFSERIAALFASNSTDSDDAATNTAKAAVSDNNASIDDSGKPRIEIHSTVGTQTTAISPTSAQSTPAATDIQLTPSTTDAQDAIATSVTPDITATPATHSAIAPTDAKRDLASVANSPVPEQDIAPDFRKQPFPVDAKDESAAAEGTQFSNQPTVADVAQIAATPTSRDSSSSHLTDSASGSAPNSHNGTSPALSSQSAGSNRDNMNTDSTSTPATPATAAVAAATSSEQQLTKAQADGVTQVAPEQQRTRSDGLKDTSPQVKTPPTLETDSASDAAAQPAAHAPEAAAIRQVTDPAPVQAARSVSITVQLGDGQAAQASVREHAGGIDVKIITPNASSAQRVSSEMDGLRQNLNAAGIKLGNSEVSYQQGDGSRQGREQERSQPQNQSANGKEVFVMHEVNQ